MSQFPVIECPLANEEHRKAQRQYAHTFHREGQICVARAFYRLPERLQLAILLHEAGHILAGPRGGEQAANNAASRYSGVKIRYQDGPFGEELESIQAQDVSRVRKYLGL